MAGTHRRRAWGVAVVALLLAACSSGDRAPVASGSTQPASPASQVAALDPSALPADADAALAVLDELPDQIAGLRRMPDEADGEVRYGDEGQLSVAVMEASDIGTSDETNAELLAVEARRQGNTVTARQTDRSAPLLYVAGTRAVPPLHFVLWTTPDNPLVFAAGADSADDLQVLLRAFAHAAATASGATG